MTFLLLKIVLKKLALASTEYKLNKVKERDQQCFYSIKIILNQI